jgi:hypothetical protein
MICFQARRLSMIGFDPRYFVFIAPALALSCGPAGSHQVGLQQVPEGPRGERFAPARKRRSGVLDGAGIHDVKIVPHPGSLSDHYNPANKTLNLSGAGLRLFVDRRDRRRLPRGGPRHPASAALLAALGTLAPRADRRTSARRSATS